MLKEKDLIADQFDVLLHSGHGFTEIRDVKTGKQWFVDNAVEYEIIIHSYLEKRGDIYVGINPRKTKSGKTEDISFINCLVIDIDPIRPKDTPSSGQQLNQAIGLANRICLEYPTGIVISSGSGAHVYFPLVPIEPSEEIQKRIEGWYHKLQTKYNTKELRIDSTFDLPRVMRVWGSWNSKSNRSCEPLKPLDRIIRVTLDSLIPTVELITPKIPLTDTELRFERLIKNNGTLQNIVNGKIVFTSRSESDYAFSKTLLQANFRPDEVATLLLRNPSGRLDDKSFNERVRDVERIQKKIGPSEIKSLSENYFEELKTRKSGISTGFKTLDKRISGLKPGRLYVIAARPTDGKTTFLCQLAGNMAESGKKVLFFPTEVGASSIYDKYISRKTGINLCKFQSGDFTDDEKRSIENTSKTVKDLSIFIAENFALKVSDIKQKAQELMPDVIIVDFLQSMSFPNGGEPRELSQAVVSIKSIGQELQIPIILASQLHRAAEGAKTSLTQLKGSGAIEEQGDDIMYLYTLDRLVTPRPVNLDIMKSKYGEPGIIRLDFNSSVCEFKEKL